MESERLTRSSRAQVNMPPHGGARWPREKAGRRGAGLHLSMGILFSKSCQRSPGRTCGSVDCCHRQSGDKRRSEHAVLGRETNLCVSQARHPGSLRTSLRQRAFNRKRRRRRSQQTGSRLAGGSAHADGRSQQGAPWTPRPPAASRPGHHVRGKLLFAGWVLSPSPGECMNGDATGPLVLPDWEQWDSTHWSRIHWKMEIQEFDSILN